MTSSLPASSGNFSRSDMTAGTLSGFTVPHTPCTIKFLTVYNSSIRFSKERIASKASFCKFFSDKPRIRAVLYFTSKRAVIILPSSTDILSNAQIISSMLCSKRDQVTTARPISSSACSERCRSIRCSGRRAVSGGFLPFMDVSFWDDGSKCRPEKRSVFRRSSTPSTLPSSQDYPRNRSSAPKQYVWRLTLRDTAPTDAAVAREASTGNGRRRNARRFSALHLLRQA